MVGLGWLLTSLTELRRVDEKEEVARPLGAEVGEVGQGTEVLECGPERAPLEVEEALRRSGRSRVAAGVKAEPEAEGDDEAEVQSTGKLKGERMPPVELERDAVDYDVEEEAKPLLVTATTNAPHVRFAATHPGEYHLLEYDNAPCSATLNLTDLKKNSNKVCRSTLRGLLIPSLISLKLCSSTLSKRSARRPPLAHPPSSRSCTGAG